MESFEGSNIYPTPPKTKCQIFFLCRVHSYKCLILNVLHFFKLPPNQSQILLLCVYRSSVNNSITPVFLIKIKININFYLVLTILLKIKIYRWFYKLQNDHIYQKKKKKRVKFCYFRFRKKLLKFIN